MIWDSPSLILSLLRRHPRMVSWDTAARPTMITQILDRARVWTEGIMTEEEVRLT